MIDKIDKKEVLFNPVSQILLQSLLIICILPSMCWVFIVQELSTTWKLLSKHLLSHFKGVSNIEAPAG